MGILSPDLVHSCFVNLACKSEDESAHSKLMEGLKKELCNLQQKYEPQLRSTSKIDNVPLEISTFSPEEILSASRSRQEEILTICRVVDPTQRLITTLTKP
jgi:hypothetical protein